MTEQSAGARPFWIVGAILAVAAIAALGWIWRSGGVGLPGATAATTEECGARITSGSAMAPKFSREVITAFLVANGYEVAAPQAGANADELSIVGARGGVRCTITIRSATSTNAFEDLAAKTAQVALTIRPITDRDQAMLAAAGAGDFIRERPLAEHVIAVDAMAVIAHADNPVPEINIGQIRDIGAGLITTWKPLSGAETPLKLYVPLDGTAPSDYPNDLVPVRNSVMESMRERATVLATGSAIVEALKTDPTGFAILSSAFLQDTAGVRPIPIRNGPAAHPPTPDAVRAGAYPLMRRLFAYVRPDGMRDDVFVQRFVAFLASDAAREAVLTAGFYRPGAGSRAAERTKVAGDCIFGTLEAAAVAAATAGASRVGEPFRFAERSVALDDPSKGRVAELAPTIAAQRERGATVVLIGHADISGEAEDNRRLGQRRAIAVREAFEEKGVFGIITESAGEMCFNTENVSQEGRRNNQRVELWIRPAQ